MASAIAEKIAAKHNADVSSKPGHNVDTKGSIKQFAERLQRLEEEKQTLAEDIRELKAEAKDAGVNPRGLAQVVKEAMEDAEKRAKRLAHEEVVDQYRAALSLLD